MSQKYMPETRFFLDENIPLSTGKMLASLGYKVEHARMIMRGFPDFEIVAYAKKNNAIFVTKDLEIGNLLIYPEGTHYGLIIIRTPNYYTADQITSALKELITKININEIVNSILILEVGRYRIRKL